MITLNELAWLAWLRLLYNTPYDTGNLARNGIGSVETMGPNAAGFELFQKGAPYGAILNELPVINYRVTNPYTGITYTGSYVNKHYRWVDKSAEIFANEIMQYAPLRRIQ